jgi:hypothetical protein
MSYGSASQPELERSEGGSIYPFFQFPIGLRCLPRETKVFYAAWLMGNCQNKSNGSAFGFESEPLLNHQLWN